MASKTETPMPETLQALSPGALRLESGGVRWCVWAPRHEEVVLVTWPEGNRSEHKMEPVGHGYHVHQWHDAREGLRYAFKLSDGGEYPDPASRWQPEGVHRPSAVFFPETFEWGDGRWRGLPREELVIYELHVGTFTPEGTLAAVAGRLAELKSLGVTAVEIMPLGQFSGERNWGYDGVYPFAVQNSYGGPRALQRLVDEAHRLGMAVFLDVVYNHLGPEGNYVGKFGPFFTGRYHTPWGDAVNYDGPHSDPVRRFVIDNAVMWVRDFHVDGLRLDAVHAIYDFSARHILAEMREAVGQAVERAPAEGGSRIVHVIAETSQNDVRLIDPASRGGYGLDGVWSDDFHHSVWTVLSGERDGYYQDYGRPQHLAKAFNDAFVYDGCYSPFRKRRHGSRAEGRDRTRFVVCVQNHDQVGNRALGDRPAVVLPPEAQRLACGLLMLSPYVPLLFMGEEYAESRPFPFFCSFSDAELIEAVRRGRREEFAALEFRWRTEIPDPQDLATFAAAKLTWEWPEGSAAAGMRRLYGDLLSARRRWPPLCGREDRQHATARCIGRAEGEGEPWGLLVERGRNEKLLAAANLTCEEHELPQAGRGGHEPILSTHEPRYGGRRELGGPISELKPYELVIFAKGEWGRTR